jgi:hypothetical protein
VTEIPGHMAGIKNNLEIARMALIAISVRELVIPVHMTRLTLGCHVRSRERECCCAMIERRRHPGRRPVARLAIMAEVACDMVRIQDRLKICLMTLVAVGIDNLVVAIGMTRLAIGCHMRSCERKGRRAMVK